MGDSLTALSLRRLQNKVGTGEEEDINLSPKTMFVNTAQIKWVRWKDITLSPYSVVILNNIGGYTYIILYVNILLLCYFIYLRGYYILFNCPVSRVYMCTCVVRALSLEKIITSRWFYHTISVRRRCRFVLFCK